jgi:hypothetical protein
MTSIDFYGKEAREMPETEERKRGAPFGNQNARKHGFYSRVLDPEEQADFEQATEVEGIDEEIALVRVKLKSLIAREPDNTKLIMQGVATLEKLVRTKYNISKEDRQGLKEAIANVLRDVAIPIGVGIGKVMRNNK